MTLAVGALDQLGLHTEHIHQKKSEKREEISTIQHGTTGVEKSC